MTDLVRSFKVLAEAPGVDPWDAAEFAQWVKRNSIRATCATITGRFVLDIWNGDLWHPEERPDWWDIPRFDIVFAMRIWDAETKQAFLDWFSGPHP